MWPQKPELKRTPGCHSECKAVSKKARYSCIKHRKVLCDCAGIYQPSDISKDLKENKEYRWLVCPANSSILQSTDNFGGTNWHVRTWFPTGKWQILQQKLSEKIWARLALQLFLHFASCSSQGCHFWGMCWKLNWLMYVSANYNL